MHLECCKLKIYPLTKYNNITINHAYLFKIDLYKSSVVIKIEFDNLMIHIGNILNMYINQDRK
jgi:hypothetical protein